MKKWLQKIIFPGRKVGTILACLFLLSVAAIFLLDLSDTPAAYICYLFSAYGLYLLVRIVLLPLLRSIKYRLRQYPLLDRYWSDPQFRSRIILYRGTVFNILYALFKLVMGITYESFWFIAIAFYYIALSVIRLILIRNDVYLIRTPMDLSDRHTREWKTYRLVGSLVMVLNLTLSGILFQIIWQNRSYSYHGMLIFVMAAYAFYRISIALVRLIRQRGQGSPVFAAARIIDVLFAVISIYTLQTAMLFSFGTRDASFVRIFNIIGGILTMAISLGIASYMIIHAQHQLEEYNETPSSFS